MGFTTNINDDDGLVASEADEWGMAESAPPVTVNGLRLTDEQEEIRSADYGAPGLTVINAYAGSGKTSTLELICKANPRAKILYTCYNRALSEEAKGKFPGNVTVRTTHSLAYGHMVRVFGKDKIGRDLRPAEIAQRLGCKRKIAVAVRDTLAGYLQRPGLKFEVTDIPVAIRELVDQDAVIEAAMRLWEMMKDPKDSAPMPHNGYLKLWVASMPELRFDIVLLDEAQDTAPVVESLVLNQKSQRSVCLVGDDHQGLYGFNGAVNAMARAVASADRRFKLSTAFRLRAPAAALASSIIRLSGDMTNIRPGNDGPLNAKGGSSVIIARANAMLLERAFQLVDQGLNPHFIGTRVEDRYSPQRMYNFEEILDINRLRRGERHLLTTQYIQMFDDYAQLMEIADPDSSDVTDRDLALGVKLVRQYGDKLPDMVDKVCRSSAGPQDADVVITTAHKAKGLEWDHVEMLSDFPSFAEIEEMRKEEMAPQPDETGINMDTRPKKRKRKRRAGAWREEANVLYVGVTRARDEIAPPINLYDPVQPKRGKSC